MYKEGLGSVYHSWYLASKFFDWHFFHPSEKNILNQYIFVDDLVSNIFKLKKCLLALSHISACQIHDCVADRFCKGVCNPRTQSQSRDQ